jgi:hypothetical protein
MLPLERTARLLAECYGVPLCAATVTTMIGEAQQRLAPTAARIAEALAQAPVAGADETGLRVAGKLHWLHTTVTEALTWMGLHTRRGKEAFAAFGILTAANPPAPPSGKRGPTRQSVAFNLLRRLREHADDVLRFTRDPRVPFSNNRAEQAIRMPKVKQKVSGCFRTPAGAVAFCTARSYLATLQKQGFDLLQSLVLAFQGNVPQPRLSG